MGHELLERVERGRVRRVSIDSLDDLGFMTKDEVRFRAYVLARSTLRVKRGQPDIDARGSEPGARAHGLKARASALEPTVREFNIRPDGIVLGDELQYGHDIR